MIWWSQLLLVLKKSHLHTVLQRNLSPVGITKLILCASVRQQDLLLAGKWWVSSCYMLHSLQWTRSGSARIACSILEGLYCAVCFWKMLRFFRGFLYNCFWTAYYWCMMSKSVMCCISEDFWVVFFTIC